MADGLTGKYDSAEKLTGLYQEDPELFEAERKKLIQETIDSFPPEYRTRAQGLQFKIEATLDRYKDPVARMNKMVELFWGYFQDFQDVINDPAAYLEKTDKEKEPGKVLRFNR
jgi:hypothetical protein